MIQDSPSSTLDHRPSMVNPTLLHQPSTTDNNPLVDDLSTSPSARSNHSSMAHDDSFLSATFHSPYNCAHASGYPSSPPRRSLTRSYVQWSNLPHPHNAKPYQPIAFKRPTDGHMHFATLTQSYSPSPVPSSPSPPSLASAPAPAPSQILPSNAPSPLLDICQDSKDAPFLKFGSVIQSNGAQTRTEPLTHPSPKTEQHTPIVKSERSPSPAPEPAAPIFKRYLFDDRPRNGKELRRLIGKQQASTSRVPSKFPVGVEPSFTITTEITLDPRPNTSAKGESASEDRKSNAVVVYPGLTPKSLDGLRQTHPPPKELVESGVARKVHRASKDMYSPRWIRPKEADAEGEEKECWCAICPEGGKWYSMKRSQYMYHVQYTHGISSLTYALFTPPTHLLKWNDCNATTEGMCHACRCWVPITYGSKRRISFMAWWKHAHECHTEHRGRRKGGKKEGR